MRPKSVCNRVAPRLSAPRCADFRKRRVDWRTGMGDSKYILPGRAKRSTSLSPPPMGTEASQAITKLSAASDHTGSFDSATTGPPHQAMEVMHGA
jgi:hypothetical protein